MTDIQGEKLTLNMGPSHPAMHGTIRMVLDLGVVEYMSSAGLGRLVACLKKARASGGDLILAQVRAEIYELLDLMKLTQIFTVKDTVEDAKACLLEGA